jgi:hypothetical protein
VAFAAAVILTDSLYTYIGINGTLVVYETAAAATREGKCFPKN